MVHSMLCREPQLQPKAAAKSGALRESQPDCLDLLYLWIEERNTVKTEQSIRNLRLCYKSLEPSGAEGLDMGITMPNLH